jgi:protein SCO1
VQYQCPSLCSTILNDLMATLKVIPQDIGTEYDVWTVSFDPKEDAALAREKKKGYVQTYLRTRPEAVNTSGGWHFLTGDQENITRLTEAVGFHYRWDEPTQQYIHPAALTMLTPEGRISRYFFGIDYKPLDLRLSLVEASKGKIGGLTDAILLFCYHYDPATGRYGLAVINALKVGAALTLCLLGLGMWWLWRVDRRRTRKLLAQVKVAQPPEEGGRT